MRSTGVLVPAGQSVWRATGRQRLDPEDNFRVARVRDAVPTQLRVRHVRNNVPQRVRQRVVLVLNGDARVRVAHLF